MILGFITWYDILFKSDLIQVKQLSKLFKPFKFHLNCLHEIFIIFLICGYLDSLI
jgi:hypothetical protein